MSASKRVLLVDDHEIVRRGVRALLEAEPGYLVCGEAGTGREAIAAARSLSPDLIVMDRDLPDLSGLEAIRAISPSCPQAKILVFTFSVSGEEMRVLFASGAHGCVLKGDLASRLVQGLAAISQGNLYLPNGALQPRPELAPTLVPTPFAALTKRELEMAGLLAKGRSNKEAASDMGISVKTAETHRARIMRKLKLRCFAELVHLAMETGLIKTEKSKPYERK